MVYDRADHASWNAFQDNIVASIKNYDVTCNQEAIPLPSIHTFAALFGPFYSGPLSFAEAGFSGPFFVPEAGFSGPFIVPEPGFSGPFIVPEPGFSGPFIVPEPGFSGPFTFPVSGFSGPFTLPGGFSGPFSFSPARITYLLPGL